MKEMLHLFIILPATEGTPAQLELCNFTVGNTSNGSEGGISIFWTAGIATLLRLSHLPLSRAVSEAGSAYNQVSDGTEVNRFSTLFFLTGLEGCEDGMMLLAFLIQSTISMKLAVILLEPRPSN